MVLRPNQQNAIDVSINNEFESGIHYHATGAGKSWIAMHIVDEFHKKYPKKNILWLCERKDILMQQFSKAVLNERGFGSLCKKFNVLDFVTSKNGKWYDSLNASSFWGMPYLCIINRCFLTSKKKYVNIKKAIDLIIHDECHSIENTTTQEFYTWVQQAFPQVKIIGFSATPEYIMPLSNILTSYSIYDAFKDGVILPPKIVWVKSESTPTHKDLLTLVKMEVTHLPYKKLIVWCGIIDECVDMAHLWQPYFKDYLIAVDFNGCRNTDFASFEEFYHANQNAILFCAVKHREGSDIPSLDGCIFMDKVEKRSERVFIQSMGRVLRKDALKKKHYGLVIDIKAKSSIEICNRVQYYLRLRNLFPWKYELRKEVLDGTPYFVNSLKMTTDVSIPRVVETCEERFDKNDITQHFVREIPHGDAYVERLEKELALIIEKNLFGNMKRALEILEITKHIPHVTRGSCGSSLVCYLLGISHMDPVKHNICFARFINQYRNTLPDIDFDFPHYLRDEVFLKLFQKWGDKVARISNHNYYHEKSALRESLRRNGVNEFISKYELQRKINSFSDEFQEQIYQTQKELDGQFRGYSLHCGGIIYFPDGVPDDYILDGSNKQIMQQVHLNKHDVAEQKNFKIDILSSRGLSQLYYCRNFTDIDFNMHLGDAKTIALLASGNNLGITLAETPLMKKALLLIKPKTISELATCLAIIRPAAKDAKKEFELGKYRKDNMVYDDDVIHLIAKLVKCDEEMADKLRRGYCKDDKEAHTLLNKFIERRGKTMQTKIKNMLGNLRKYGFCKAHALSYAQLVWQLAYEKAHHPKKFWEATLKNTQTCYRKWVHLYEAKCNGVTMKAKEDNMSLYARQRYQKENHTLSKREQLSKYGYWHMTNTEFIDGCYYFKIAHQQESQFCGIVATSRMIQRGKKSTLIVCLCIERNRFIELLVTGKCGYNTTKNIIQGKGVLKNEDMDYPSLTCKGKELRVY